VVGAEEWYGLDQGFERGNGADDDGDAGLDDRPQDDIRYFDCKSVSCSSSDIVFDY
jgi:hypothetical protein